MNINHSDQDLYKEAVNRGFFEGQYADWLELTAAQRDNIAGHMGKGVDHSNPEALTSERHNQHGDWLAQSKMGFRLKEMMRKSKNWSTLEAHQAEALDMIATKMSRILTGDPAHEDHWDDISGYAYLGKAGHKKA